MSAHNRRKQSSSFSFGEFVWWIGVVEDRMDPEKMGRVRVRIYGYHTKELDKIPKDKLMWATVMLPVSGASLGGIGVSPTGLLPGSHVFGFFVDGHNAQMPLVIGSYVGKPGKKDSGEGFCDPEGKFPKYDPDECDCNRTARNEKTDKTCVKKRKDDQDKKVDIAFKPATWDERLTPYAAKYPYNHVRETESGHVEEFDDTEGAERYLLWHKSGSFTEIHPDGTEVHKIKKDGYEIVYGDDRVHIKGACHVTIEGESTVLIKGNANIEVKGNVKEKIHGNYDLEVLGNMTTNVKGKIAETSAVLSSYKAPRINLN